MMAYVVGGHVLDAVVMLLWELFGRIYAKMTARNQDEADAPSEGALTQLLRWLLLVAFIALIGLVVVALYRITGVWL